MPQSGNAASDLDVNIVAVQREVSAVNTLVNAARGALFQVLSLYPAAAPFHEIVCVIRCTHHAQVRYASVARHPNIVQLLDVFVEFKQIVIVVRTGNLMLVFASDAC